MFVSRVGSPRETEALDDREPRVPRQVTDIPQRVGLAFEKRDQDLAFGDSGTLLVLEARFAEVALIAVYVSVVVTTVPAVDSFGLYRALGRRKERYCSLEETDDKFLVCANLAIDIR